MEYRRLLSEVPFSGAVEESTLGIDVDSLRVNVLCLLGLLLTANASSQSTPKHTITFQDLMSFKRVSDPSVSPDGKWVVISVRGPGSGTDESVSDLWLISADGSAAPHRLTDSSEGESDVSWAPDSLRIAFSTQSKRDVAEQIYTLDVTGGGGPTRFTDLSTGASNPHWNSDGQTILFESMVYPGALDDNANQQIEAERKARRYSLRVYDGGPPRIWNAWMDGRRPTILVQSVSPGARPRDILSTTQLAQTPGFWGVVCCNSAAPTLQPTWSPGSGEVIFNATTQLNSRPVDKAEYRLYRISLGGGTEPKAVTPTFGSYDQAKFAPDGSTLFFTYAPVNDQPSNLALLKAVSWPNPGAARPVAPGYGRLIENFAISSDSREVYLQSPVSGRTDIFRVPATGGLAHLVLAPEQGGYKDLVVRSRAAEPELIALYGSAILPPELVRVNIGQQTHVNLTNFNAAAANAIDWQPLVHFFFKNRNGDMIHNMVVYPPNFDPKKKYPMFSFMHGGADYYDEDQIGYRWNYHLLAATGVVVLLTDYTGSAGFGEAFARKIKGDPLRISGDDVNQAVEEAIQRYPFIDGTRVCAGGGSYGGHLANWLEATTTRYRCLISHAGLVDQTLQWGEGDHQGYPEQLNGGPPWSGSPIYTAQNPLSYAREWKTPMLLSVGERDFRVPIGNDLTAYETLRSQHIPVRLLVWPRAWHYISNTDDSRRFYLEIQSWLKKYLLDQDSNAEPTQ